MLTLPEASTTSLVLSLIKASLILSLAQLLVAATPRLAASVRHLLLTLGILAFALLPMLTIFTPSWSLPVLPGEPAPVTLVTSRTTTVESSLPVIDHGPMQQKRPISFSTARAYPRFMFMAAR